MSSYFEPSAQWERGGSSLVPVVRPNLANGAAATSNVANWVYGVWVQLVAANDLASHMLIALGMSSNTAAAGTFFQMDVGTGLAGFEVVIGTFRFVQFSIAGAMVSIPVLPFLVIPANVRVAVRCADSAGNNNLAVTGQFIPRPLE